MCIGYKFVAEDNIFYGSHRYEQEAAAINDIGKYT
jgi:hypothetical protein